MTDIVLVDFTQRDAYPYIIHNGFRYLAAFARSKGLSVRILYNADRLDRVALHAAYLDQIVQERPLLVGFSPIDESFMQICTFVRKLKRRRVPSKIVLGGFFATFNHNQILKDYDLFDFVVRGEGEETLHELAVTVKHRGSLRNVSGISFRRRGSVCVNPPRPYTHDLDSLPFPATDGYERAMRQETPIEQAVISSSRGCYRRCSFCSVRSFYSCDPFCSPWRARSIPNVVDEIQILYRQFGVSFFSICDDNFVGPGAAGRQRAIDFASEILARGLKITFEVFCRADNIDGQIIDALCGAGLRIIFFGLESGVQQALDVFHKQTTIEQNEAALRLLLRCKDLAVVVGYIFFNPYMTAMEVSDNARYLEELLKRPVDIYPRNPIRACLIPFSGTPIQDRLRRDGLLTGNYKRGYFYHFQDRRIDDVFNLVKAVDRLLEIASADLPDDKQRKAMLYRSFSPELRMLRRVGEQMSRHPEMSLADALADSQAERCLSSILSIAGIQRRNGAIGHRD